MTWRMWANAVTGFSSFLLDDNNDREWQFLILEEGYEDEVGWGSHLANEKNLND